MIDHKNKFIFIHIPRTGGTSIESAFTNKDWWNIHAPTKHINCHIAKKIYKEYWDEYFKFCFVRNPWDRTVSMLKYKNDFCIEFDKDNKMNLFKHYNKYHGMEYDSRFFHPNQFKDVERIKNSVYLNTIGKEMNFIGRFERLQEDFDVICDHIKIPKMKLAHKEKSNRQEYQKYYNEDSKNLVAKMYARDIQYLQYKFE